MTVIVQWLVCITTSNKHFTLKMAGRTREFPFLFVLLISRPVIIISCSAIGESYPDGGGSCSFEESRCGWSTDYGWTLILKMANDNFIWLTTENLRLSYPAKLKSPELCSTRGGLYLLAFVYTIKYPQEVMLSVHISVHNEEVFLWSSQTGQQGNIKSSELIDLNCTLCRNNSFIIFFKGKKLCSDCYYGEVYLHSVSLHFNGSLQTTSTYVTHSTTIFTDVATVESTTSFPNRTAIGMNGDHSAQCGHENRLPPGAEASIAIIIMLLIIVIVSIIIMHQRKKKRKKTDHGVRWRSNRKTGEATEAVSKSEKISVDNSAHTNDDNQSAKRTTSPGKIYGFKPQNADVELANAAISEDYYVINEDVDRQRTNGNVSNPTVFHTNSHNDFVPDNDYNKLHANPTNNHASPDVYNHLQSSCLQGTSDKEGVYSLADSDVKEYYVNHEYIMANAVLDDSDEYNRVKASSSKTKDDTYNHLTKDVTC